VAAILLPSFGASSLPTRWPALKGIFDAYYRQSWARVELDLDRVNVTIAFPFAYHQKSCCKALATLGRVLGRRRCETWPILPTVTLAYSGVNEIAKVQVKSETRSARPFARIFS
jgi:hypothetical protein